MKPFLLIPQFQASIAARIPILILHIAIPALAADIDLAVDPSTVGLGKFAAEEIRLEAADQGMTSYWTECDAAQSCSFPFYKRWTPAFLARWS